MGLICHPNPKSKTNSNKLESLTKTDKWELSFDLVFSSFARCYSVFDSNLELYDRWNEIAKCSGVPLFVNMLI